MPDRSLSLRCPHSACGFLGASSSGTGSGHRVVGYQFRHSATQSFDWRHPPRRLVCLLLASPPPPPPLCPPPHAVFRIANKAPLLLLLLLHPVGQYSVHFFIVGGVYSDFESRVAETRTTRDSVFYGNSYAGAKNHDYTVTTQDHCSILIGRVLFGRHCKNRGLSAYLTPAKPRP